MTTAPRRRKTRKLCPWNSYWTGMISTVNLLVLTSIVQLLSYTSYLKIDFWMACTACLVCQVSTVSGGCKNTPRRAIARSEHITTLEQSTFLRYLWPLWVMKKYFYYFTKRAVLIVYLVPLKNWDWVNALAEVPQPERRVLRRRHDEPGGRVRRRVRQLVVVTRQLGPAL